MFAKVPITGTQHPLPLQQLDPLDFERLCFAIVQRLGYQEPEHPGAAGRDKGVDISAKQGTDLVAVQCKRVQNLPPSLIRKAVAKLRKLQPDRRPAEIIFMTSCAVSKEAREAAETSAADLFRCRFLDATFIDDFVRRHHDLLNRYFMIPGPKEKADRGYPCMASPVASFIDRPELGLLRDLLCGTVKHPGASMVALCGGAGFGKTTLARKIAFDPTIRSRYHDGILWARIGRGAGPSGTLVAIADLYRWWTSEEPPAFETPDAAASFLQDGFLGRSLLIILDDVWDELAVALFEGLPAYCSALVTTRNRQILPSSAATIEVGPLSLPASSNLLLQGFDSIAPEVRRTAVYLAEQLGRWPLGLSLSNSQLHVTVSDLGLNLPQALSRMTSQLQDRGIDSLSWQNTTARRQAIKLTIDASINELAPVDRLRFRGLAVFPAGMEIPLTVLQRFWGLGASETESLCARLFSLSLAASASLARQSIQLHDIFSRYLRELAGAALASLHSDLLRAVVPTTGRWEDLSDEDTYLWRFLAYHLSEAGDQRHLRHTLFRFSYLKRKLATAGVTALLEDFDRLPKDPEVLALRDSLRLSSGALVAGGYNLAPHILGRLQGVKGGSVSSLLREARRWREGPWLRPLTGSFSPPGGPLVRTLLAHRSSVTSFAHLSQARIASCSLDAVRLWDTGDWIGKPFAEIPVVGGYAIAAISDSQLVVGGIGGALEFWDLTSENCTSRIALSSRAVRSICLLGSEAVAVGTEDGIITVLDIASALPLIVFSGHVGAVLAVASLGGRRLISGGVDGTLRIWNLDGFGCEAVLRQHTRAVNAIVADGHSKFVSASDDRTICVWDLSSGTLIDVLSGHRGAVKALLSTGEGKIVSGSSDRTLRLWKLDTGKQLKVYSGHSDCVDSAMAIDSSTVISGCRDGAIGVWNLEGGNAARRDRRRHVGWVRTVRPVGRSLVASGSDDRTIRLWRRRTGAPLAQPLQHEDWVRSITPINDFYFLSTSDDGVIRLWNLMTGRAARILRGHSGWVWKAVALGAARLISCASDRTAILWDLTTGRPTRGFRGSGAWASTIASLDNENVVFGSLDWRIRIRNSETGSLVRVFDGHTAWVTQIEVIQEGKFASASLDGTVRVFDAHSGEGLCTIVGHSGSVTGLAVIEDTWLATVSLDRTIRIWDLNTGRGTISLTLDHELLSVAYAGGQQPLLVVGDTAGRVHFLEICYLS